ncbi:MAG: ATP-binding protein [Ruminiclostridium sp.]|nr:ATP-binding protein [Ruminiclostridium sp.]
MTALSTKQDRWTIINQTFRSSFITFSLTSLTNRGATIIDGLFVSNFLGVNEIASVGIAKLVFSMTAILSGLFAVGMQSKCSYELGKGEVRSFNRVFCSIFYIVTALSAFFGVLLFVTANPVAILLGAAGKGAELADGAASYLRGIAVGFPALVLVPVLSPALQLDSAKNRVRKSTILYFASNFLLDYLAVKTHMGVLGIGLSTSVANYIQLGYLMLHFTAKDRMLRFTKANMTITELLETFQLGSERATTSLGVVVSSSILNRLILYYGGTLAMSAYAVQKDMFTFSEVFAVGLANATALQTSVNYGEMNGEYVYATGKIAHRNCLICLGCICAILLFLARPIAGLYISERGELYDLVVFASIMTAFYAPLNGLVRARISYLNCIKLTKNAQLMVFLSTIVYMLLSAWILGFLFGAKGELAAQLARVCLLCVSVWIYYACKCKKIIPTGTDYLNLPETFHISPGNIISLDIRNEEDISLVTEQIQLFCKGHKISKQIGMKAAICFEELTINIIRHGFPKCKGNPGIDLRIVFIEDQLVMRIRDNCSLFNVERYMAQEKSNCENEDDLRLGIKVVASLADQISYVHSMETNNVIVKFQLK